MSWFWSIQWKLDLRTCSLFSIVGQRLKTTIENREEVRRSNFNYIWFWYNVKHRISVVNETPINMWRCYLTNYVKDRYQLNYFLYLFGFLFCHYVSLRSEFRVVLPLQFPHRKQCSVRRYHHLFVGGIMSWLRYMCLLSHSGVQCILCFGFLRFVYPMLPFSLDCQLLIASLVFYNVYVNNN